MCGVGLVADNGAVTKVPKAGAGAAKNVCGEFHFVPHNDIRECWTYGRAQCTRHRPRVVFVAADGWRICPMLTVDVRAGCKIGSSSISAWRCAAEMCSAS